MENPTAFPNCQFRRDRRAHFLKIGDFLGVSNPFVNFFLGNRCACIKIILQPIWPPCAIQIDVAGQTYIRGQSFALAILEYEEAPVHLAEKTDISALNFDGAYTVVRPHPHPPGQPATASDDQQLPAAPAHVPPCPAEPRSCQVNRPT